MKIIERNLQEIGHSLLVTLPKHWTKSLKLKKGSKVKIMISGEGDLRIAPEFTIKEKKKEVSIDFDDYFARRFFREYFFGNEKITIHTANIGDKNRKELYSFLKKFMNAQIIEETESKIVVKCFKIEELSIEDCLRRMHFLSLNMFDEAMSKNNKTKLAEMEDSITRFYYMLVMQIRRFLSEGKFAEENQIPLVRALDFRMVAEKIERISDILMNLDKVEDKKILSEVKEYYKKSFASFISSNFDKALSLWTEEKHLPEKIRHNDNLMHLLNYAKDISMLVR